jgi:hypothetical protein
MILSFETPNDPDQWLAAFAEPQRLTLSRVRCIAWFSLPLDFIPGIAKPKDPERCGEQPAPRRDLQAR